MMLSAFFVQMVVKTTAILIAACGLTAAMAHRSAAARQRVWASALLATLVLPLIIIYGPAWSVPAPLWTTPIDRFEISRPLPLPSAPTPAAASERNTRFAFAVSPRLFEFVPVQH